MPEEYHDYRACRLYACTPSQLDAEDDDRVRLHLAFQAVEERVLSRRDE
ncbi:MAG: hypothetical protein IPK19_19325 [Chloroflexi bacterium]|nr:hypothetical protein [Chloroflexota bacterium]